MSGGTRRTILMEMERADNPIFGEGDLKDLSEKMR
jgi:hypothetical protein